MSVEKLQNISQFCFGQRAGSPFVCCPWAIEDRMTHQRNLDMPLDAQLQAVEFYIELIEIWVTTLQLHELICQICYLDTKC